MAKNTRYECRKCGHQFCKGKWCKILFHPDYDEILCCPRCKAPYMEDGEGGKVIVNAIAIEKGGK